jgi:hypothetical protein
VRAPNARLRLRGEKTPSVGDRLACAAERAVQRASDCEGEFSAWLSWYLPSLGFANVSRRGLKLSESYFTLIFEIMHGYSQNETLWNAGEAAFVR